MIKVTIELERAINLRVAELKMEINQIFDVVQAGGVFDPQEVESLMRELSYLTHPDQLVRCGTAQTLFKTAIDKVIERLEA